MIYQEYENYYLNKVAKGNNYHFQIISNKKNTDSLLKDKIIKVKFANSMDIFHYLTKNAHYCIYDNLIIIETGLFLDQQTLNLIVDYCASMNKHFNNNLSITIKSKLNPAQYIINSINNYEIDTIIINKEEIFDTRDLLDLALAKQDENKSLTR